MIDRNNGEMLQSLLCLSSGGNMSAKGAVQSRTQKHVCTRAHLFIINSVLQTIIRMPVTCQGTEISHVCHLSQAQQQQYQIPAVCYIQLSIYEFHIVEAYVVVPFIWVWLIHQQHAKPWDGSRWRGIRLTGGKQSLAASITT